MGNEFQIVINSPVKFPIQIIIQSAVQIASRIKKEEKKREEILQANVPPLNKMEMIQLCSA